jgi:hypothetical protein
MIVIHQKLLELFIDPLSWKERESDRVKKMINVIYTPSLTKRRGRGMSSWNNDLGRTSPLYPLS